MSEKKFDNMKEYSLEELYRHVVDHMDDVSKFIGKNCDENGVMSETIDEEEIRKVLDGSIAAQAICGTFFNHLAAFTAHMDADLRSDLINFFRASESFAKHFNEQATSWMALHGVPLKFDD